MLTAIFIVGKLGPVEGDYRYVLVEKVKHHEDDQSRVEYDRFKVKLWSDISGVLHRLREDTMVSIKGRLEEQNGDVFVIAELFRSF
jgi:hypothetical protein